MNIRFGSARSNSRHAVFLFTVLLCHLQDLEDKRKDETRSLLQQFIFCFIRAILPSEGPDHVIRRAIVIEAR